MKTLYSRFLLITAVSTLLLFMFAMPLAAQTVSPRSPAQKEADVQWFLTNDDDVAKLKLQLGAKEITNLEYTKRLNELANARKEVLARYDRNGQREIVGLYNAAKKDVQQAAAEAKRKADAEARAKAIAERDAAKLAAAEEAKAKAAAAQEQARQAAAAKAEALAAENKILEEDAQAYTKLALRHDELFFKQNMQKITPAEKSEMPGLAAQGDAIKKKYAAGGPSVARSVEFQNKLKQLSQEQMVPAAKGWMADVFPDPAKVSADYSDETDRAAALVFLGKLLGDKAPAPHAEAVSRKISSYRQAVEKINPSSDSDSWKKSKKYNAQAENPEFRSEVVKKYLPAFVAEFQFVAKQEKVVAKQKAVSKRMGFGVTLIGLALVAAPLVFAMTGGFFSRPKKISSEEGNDLLPLPRSLSAIKVLGKEYEVSIESGQIYDKENWTETSVSTTTSGGGAYNQPVQTHTHVSSTVYHRYWIRTLEGKETWKKFSDDLFPASIGQIISTVDWKTDVIIAYNHGSGHYATGSRWTRGPHRLPGKKLWCVNMVIWLVGYFAVSTLLGGSGSSEVPHQKDLLWGGAIMAAIASAIYIVILKLIFQNIRNSQFKRNYAPAFRKFMEERTPELLKRFPALSVAPAR